MRLTLVGATLIAFFMIADATFLMMDMSGSGPVCCCGCENTCPPQAPSCPPPQNPCPQTSYWFGQQYRKCNSYNNGVAWRQPYSEFVSSGGLQPSYNSYPPGDSPTSSFQQNYNNNNNNFLYPAVASTSQPLYPHIDDTYNFPPLPAAPPAELPYPPAAAPSYPAPPSAPVVDTAVTGPTTLQEVEPAALHQDAETLVENEHEPYEQFDNPTDRSPQVIPILKTVHIPPLRQKSNTTDYDGEYVDIDALPKQEVDHQSNHIDPIAVRQVNSDIITTNSVSPKIPRKSIAKSKFALPNNKSADPEMVRIGHVLGEIEKMLEMVKKEMEISVYDELSPERPEEEVTPKRYFSAEYETEFVNILDEEDKEPTQPSEEVATTRLPDEVEPTKRNMTMQEIIESLRMQHIRAERRKKFLETLEARALADQGIPRQKRDSVSEGDIHSLTQSGLEIPSNRTNGSVGTGTGIDFYCNNDELKEIIDKELFEVYDSSVAKRKIQKAAENKLKGIFNVVCSTSEFSFVINSALYCESGNGKVACFAFLEPGSV